jgi:hypothetical protein
MKRHRNLVILAITSVILAVGMPGCKKDSSPNNLAPIEASLKQDLTSAQGYNTQLADRLQLTGMEFSDSLCHRYDSLYHQCDTSFTMDFQRHCRQMAANMNGGNMMGGGMMGGGMYCNMDSIEEHINGMPHMNTYRMDSLLLADRQYCPGMAPVPQNVQEMYDQMQALRISHRHLHGW